MKISKPLLTMQQGLGLLELMLALAIAAALLIAGIKQYESYETNARITMTKDTVDTLLEKTGEYYQENCLTDPFYANNHPSEFATLTTQTLSAKVDAPQALNLSQIAGHVVQPAYFGAFEGGQPFNAFLTVVKNTNPNNKDKNRFGAIWTWHARVDACVQTLGSDPATLKSMFNADSAQTGESDCSNGVVLTWERLPRNETGVMNAAQAEYNRQYRFGQWMLEPGSQVNPEVFNYLCQY